MGSSYFYLEFLVAWISRLKQAGFQNPGFFALEYTLVPDATWPTQVDETTAGWNFLCEHITDASKICICGDSAGATLVLSHLLRTELDSTQHYPNSTWENDRAATAILISPWTDLVSSLNRDTESDYLCKETLEIYAKQYAGNRNINDISPSGNSQQWKAVSPRHGFAFVYGAEEVFRPAIVATAERIRNAGCDVSLTSMKGGIHAWPVVDLFLANSTKRLRGLDKLTDIVWKCFHSDTKQPAPSNS